MTGHHVGRIGELILFDPAAGRHEADGVVQRIPGYGEKVEPITTLADSMNSVKIVDAEKESISKGQKVSIT